MTQDALTATDQSQAVEREAAVPGGEAWEVEVRKTLCDAAHTISNLAFSGEPPDQQEAHRVCDRIKAVLSPQSEPDFLKAQSCPKCGLEAKTLLFPFCKHDDCPIRPLLAASPAHRPPQPGVVTEDLREAATAATAGLLVAKKDYRRSFPWRIEGPNAHVAEINHCRVGDGDDPEAEANAKFLSLSANFVRDILAAPSSGASSPADGDVIAALREADERYTGLLAYTNFRPSRAHIEDARNVIRDALSRVIGWEGPVDALRDLITHCDAMEAEHTDYHLLSDDGIPCRSAPLNNARAALSRLEASQPASSGSAKLADAIEAADWSDVSIGNKALLRQAIATLRATPTPAAEDAGLVEALKAALPVLESIEAKALVGDEGCIWAAEIVRDALSRAGGRT
jgi:hypothetical protein